MASILRREVLRRAALCASVTLAGCAKQAGTANIGTPTPPGTTGGSTTPASIAPTVFIASTETFGDILIDRNRMTLYLSTNDTPGESVCDDECVNTWPPLTNEGPLPPAARPEVTGPLDTIKRENGSLQVTIADHPLYNYSGDEKPGDTSGQRIDNVWFVVGPNGQKKTAVTNNQSVH